MAGVKGMKGSGGARPGAGRKPAPKTHALAQIVVAQAAKVVAQGAGASQPTPPPPVVEINTEASPLDFMLAVMRNPGVDDKLRLEAAKAAAVYIHTKKADAGVKDEKAERAKKAGAGKFAAAAAPLRMVK